MDSGLFNIRYLYIKSRKVFHPLDSSSVTVQTYSPLSTWETSPPSHKSAPSFVFQFGRFTMYIAENISGIMVGVLSSEVPD